MITRPLLPPSLRQGDTLGIIAPAGQLADKNCFEKGVALLREMGFVPRFPRDLWPGDDYLADSDENRAEEFNAFIGDPEVKGLISMRGGYGCLRILDMIDIEAVRQNPKFIVGFSDISILLNYLYKMTGLVSLHGPVVTSLSSATQDSRERLFQSLHGNCKAPIEISGLEILRAAQGRKAPVVGGNLASLVSLAGTEYDLSWRDKIVVLEDVNEPIYKIDRMLTQLSLGKKFDQLAGLVLGDFGFDTGFDDLEKLRQNEAVWKIVLRLVKGVNIPIWANFPSGHCARNISFPIGVNAEMSVENRSLIFY
jgi:muramoyltetrapeptide carboxypeptidase